MVNKKALFLLIAFLMIVTLIANFVSIEDAANVILMMLCALAVWLFMRIFKIKRLDQ